jgi:hypothetical protein
MQGIGEAIKYLYQQWILRDIVAYVTPGTILGACILKIVLDGGSVFGFVRGIPAIAYVPIYGLLFATGLAVQNFGEMVRVLWDYRRDVPRVKYSDEWARFDELRRFHQVACNKVEYDDQLERTRERIEVKKYASGNITLAALISLVLISVSKILPNSGHWPAAVVGLVLIGSLWRAHRTELRYLTIWQQGAREDAGTGTPTPPAAPWEFRVELEGRGKPIEKGGT